MVEVVTLPEVVVAVAVVSQGKTLRKQNNDINDKDSQTEWKLLTATYLYLILFELIQ